MYDGKNVILAVVLLLVTGGCATNKTPGAAAVKGCNCDVSRIPQLPPVRYEQAPNAPSGYILPRSTKKP